MTIKTRFITLDKVICLDASNKPNEISNNNWLKEGEEYTPIKLMVHTPTRQKYFVLKEVHPDNPLYGGYSVERFGIPQEIIDELIEAGEFEEVLT